jgi:hypothetical protein
MIKKVIVHPGLPKTGTTYLQREIFTRFPIGFVSPYQLKRGGVNRQGTTSLFRQVRETMLQHDSSVWDKPLGRDLTSGLKSIFEEELGKDIVLLSFENLIALDYFSPLEPENRPDPTEQILHLRKFIDLMVPNRDSLSIVLTLRRQPEFLASLYSQYTNRIPGAGKRDFERQVERILARPGQSYLDYNWLLSELNECLQPDVLRVFALEQFGDKNFSEELTETLHQKQAINPLAAADFPKHNIRRITDMQNSWEVRPLNFRGPGFAGKLENLGTPWWAKNVRPKRFEISQKILNAISDRYFPANEKLLSSYFPLGRPGAYVERG